MSAFHACSASRPLHMGGAGAVPISEILAYLELVGIASAAVRAKYLRLIQHLDAAYLSHCAEKAQTQKA